MIVEKINVSKLIENKGHIEGVPSNPRKIKDDKLAMLMRNIEKNPDFFEARPIIAVTHGTELVVIAGNMRLKAAIKLGMENVPCIIMPQSTPPEKIRAFATLDNVKFGEWNTQALAEWDVMEMSDWGVAAHELANAFRLQSNIDLRDADIKQPPTFTPETPHVAPLPVVFDAESDDETPSETYNLNAPTHHHEPTPAPAGIENSLQIATQKINSNTIKTVVITYNDDDEFVSIFGFKPEKDTYQAAYFAKWISR